jgi:3-methyl-2-oxobutanoate hydroxymethyltransferase
VESIKAIVAMDIPVMGHIGLTPQSIHRMGGYKIQGKTWERQGNSFGGCPCVQSAAPFPWCSRVSPEACRKDYRRTGDTHNRHWGRAAPDGQVLVIHDILGLCEKYSPKFVKHYADVKANISTLPDVSPPK